MDGEFCVVCGRRDVELTDGECVDCFVKRVPLVTAPERPTVVLCPTCGSRLVGQHWEPSEAGDRLQASDLTPLLRAHPEAGIRRVHWTETGGQTLVRELEGSVDLRFRGVERTRGVRMTVKIEHRTCEACSRRSGRYYTARIQLRGGEDTGHEKVAARRDRLDRAWASIQAEARATWRDAQSWKEPLPEGWDIFVTDTLAARSLARLARHRLGAEVKETATLWGRRDGHDVYRVTIRLRIPARDRPRRDDA